MVICFLLGSFSCLAQVEVLKLPERGNHILSSNYCNKRVELRRKYNYEKSDINPNEEMTKNTVIPTLTFDNNVDFNRTIFSKGSNSLTINFQNANFKEGHFYKAQFLSNVNFSEALFENKANFYTTNFWNKAIFSNVIFNDIVNFSSANFQDDVDFSFANFKKNVTFEEAVFSYKSSFNSAKGNYVLKFKKIYISNIFDISNIDSLKVDLRDVKISNIQFNKFKGIVFKNTDFKEKKININNISDENLDNYIKLGYHVTEDFALFKLSKKLNKCVVKIKGTDLTNVIVPYDFFWVDVSNYTYEEKTTLYEKLIKKCKEEGMDESVIGWSIELKKAENEHNFPIVGPFLNFFQRIFWNYGYTKSLILLWILGVFLLFNLLNFFIYPQLFRVYFNPKLGFKIIPKYLIQNVEDVIETLKKSPFIRLRYMLHYTGMIFFGIKLEHTEMSFKNLRWVVILYFQFVTGIILLGFALNFVVSK